MLNRMVHLLLLPSAGTSRRQRFRFSASCLHQSLCPAVCSQETSQFGSEPLHNSI